ncbi:hypothetical protein [Bacillus salacetis]|uniref:hypothetical protein n=1 Tax=Bacillus salacetis TaxID=2315464 RepID=UPI0014447835|nr:hypothetical protein [Bacillus salacetis]
MTNFLEQTLFQLELQRLQSDLARCENTELQKEIKADIDLLSSVIPKYREHKREKEEV